MIYVTFNTVLGIFIAGTVFGIIPGYIIGNRADEWIIAIRRYRKGE